MFVIENVLISDEIAEKQFVCHLEKCKGACCEDGDAGAPLEENERGLVAHYYEKIKSYLSSEAIAHIERKGTSVFHPDFGWVTPTLPYDNEICAYGKRDAQGVIQCAFEQAFRDGIIDWKKPISCHLFPAIIEKGRVNGYDKMNYEPRQQYCSAACMLGKKLQVPLHRFLKEAIIRKYGAAFYEVLDEAIKRKNRRTGKKSTAA